MTLSNRAEADLLWLFSEGAAVCERSVSGRQLEEAAKFAAPLPERGMRTGVCSVCEGNGWETAESHCQACDGDGRSNPAYPSGAPVASDGYAIDHEQAVRYGRLSRRWLGLSREGRHALALLYGQLGNECLRAGRGRHWALMQVAGPGLDWQGWAARMTGSDTARRSEAIATEQRALVLMQAAQEEWR